MSPLNGQTQTLELPGAKWVCTLGMQNQSESDGRIIKAFVTSLRGVSGRCNLGDMTLPNPSGAVLGNGAVYGAGQTGNVVNTVGWSLVRVVGSKRSDSSTITCDSSSTVDSSDLGYSNAFLPGDMVSVNSELKMITVTTPVDNFGNCTITVEPPFRTSPPDTTTVVTSAPTCVMRLIDDNQAKLGMKAGRIFDPVLSFIEVF